MCSEKIIKKVKKSTYIKLFFLGKNLIIWIVVRNLPDQRKDVFGLDMLLDKAKKGRIGDVVLSAVVHTNVDLTCTCTRFLNV